MRTHKIWIAGLLGAFVSLGGAALVTPAGAEAPTATFACPNTDCMGARNCEFMTGSQCNIASDGSACGVTDCAAE